MKKRVLSLAMLLVMIMIAASPAAMAATPAIRKTEYKGSGYVEVDFKKNVQYSGTSVSVRDNTGKKYSVSIVDRDGDDIKFRVKNIKSGRKYQYVIKGVRSGGSGSYTSVTGYFSVGSSSGKSGGSVSIRKVDYDTEDRELDIDFNGRVEYKSAKVTVRDSSGNKYSASIRDRDSDDMTVYVKGLKRGNTYKVTVSGVRLQGASSYATVSKSFRAVDD